jgi:hypothetical protein
LSRRNSEDPLLRAFLDTYKLNLLTIPRQNAQVGDIYIDTNDGISAPGGLQFILTSEFVMPTIKEAERMTDIKGKQTAALKLNVGLSFLEGYFNVLGAATAVGKLKVAYQQKRVSSFRFSFKDATRDSVDAMEFGRALIKCRLEGRHPFVQAGNLY